MENTNNTDILKELENINLDKDENIIISDLNNENNTEKQYTTIEFSYSIKKILKKEQNKFLSGIYFIFKYITTSASIFLVLLLTTNYSAYINIAESYIYSSDLEAKSKSLISSVEAGNIKEKYKKIVIKEKKENIQIKKETKKLTIKKIKSKQDKENIDLDIKITPYNNRIIIPKIAKNVPLLDIENREISTTNELNDIFMKELENGVIRYPGSAKPGENGTSFIFGHSSNFPWIKGDYNEVFSLLDKVEFGDEIITYYGQKKYTYKVREKRVITPGDVSVLKRNKKKNEITLMTCWPIGTTINRLIVTGELVEEE